MAKKNAKQKKSQDEASPSSSKQSSDNPKPSIISQSVFAKFILFAVLVLVLPIGTFFLVRHLDPNQNTSVAAIASVFCANVLGLMYILVAVYEKDEQEDTKKNQ